VPPAWFDPVDEGTNRRILSLKTDGYYWSRMRWWDREFKNPQYLSALSLGELGALLEWSVHNDMHMRWASVPRDPKSGEPTPAGRADNDIREVWDNPNYDFLGEFYSSHVNPVFWRLHGWIDDRISDWFQAHKAAHPGEVQQNDVQGVPWFKQGKWVHTNDPWEGPDESDHGRAGHAHGPHHDVAKMEKVVGILFGPPPAKAAALSSPSCCVGCRALHGSRGSAGFDGCIHNPQQNTGQPNGEKHRESRIRRLAKSRLFSARLSLRPREHVASSVDGVALLSDELDGLLFRGVGA
jgi:hypothetical protein